jgi:glycosyltransferase involved in cell wall biosynthesis
VPHETSDAALTVVIPAWNIGDELAQCIASIRADPMAKEIIVVDNASESALDVPPGVRVVRSRARLTLGAARNVGLAAASTRYVCFMDADDVFVGPALSTLSRRLDEEPSAVLAAGGIVLWDEETGCRVASYVPSRTACRIQRHRRALALVQAVHRVIPTAGAAVIRRHVLVRLGGFPDVVAGENWALGVSLALTGRVCMDRQPMKLYRVDVSRATLATIRASRLAEGLNARRAMRIAIRAVPGVSPFWRLISYALWPVHLASAVYDRVRSEPRSVRMIKRCREARRLCRELGDYEPDIAYVARSEDPGPESDGDRRRARRRDPGPSRDAAVARATSSAPPGSS